MDEKLSVLVFKHLWTVAKKKRSLVAMSLVLAVWYMANKASDFELKANKNHVSLEVMFKTNGLPTNSVASK